jgi:hypothetical protein
LSVGQYFYYSKQRFIVVICISYICNAHCVGAIVVAHVGDATRHPWRCGRARRRAPRASCRVARVSCACRSSTRCRSPLRVSPASPPTHCRSLQRRPSAQDLTLSVVRAPSRPVRLHGCDVAPRAAPGGRVARRSRAPRATPRAAPRAAPRPSELPMSPHDKSAGRRQLARCVRYNVYS